MLSVALTGGVGSGKTEVLRVWERAGVPVVSADELSRRAVEPGSEGLAEVRRAFGDEVLAEGGTLDRARLRDRVFRDGAARRRLELILHPRIAALREAWVRARAAEGHPVVVTEVPLLYEAGLERAFDAAVLVHASEEERVRRLLRSRGMDQAEVRRIMAAQMEPFEKLKRADYVIDNFGTLEQLEANARAVLERLQHRAAHGRPYTDLPPRPPALLRIDFHMHTCGSHDSLSQPEAVLRAARSRGVGRIAVTDHNQLGVSLRMAERHPDDVIPAEEVRTAEGIDVIGLYLHTEIPKGTAAREVCERVRAQGGLVYLPHPYAAGKGGGGRLAEELAPHVDIVEVFNGRLHDPRQNERAAQLAARHGRARGAGSDAHTLREVGRSWVELPLHPNEPAALMEALPRGRIHGWTAERWVHLGSTWAKVRHKLPGAPHAG